MQTALVNSAASTLIPSLSSPVSSPVSSQVQPGGVPFAGVMQEAMNNLKGLEDQASSTIDGLVSGRGVDVHAAMIATQKADMAFEMALAVRSKLVSAYQSMMGIQF